MRPIIGIAVLFACAVPGFSQWELGLLGGGSFRRDLSVANESREGTLKFRPGAVWGAYGGLTQHGYLGGEAHYLFEQGTMRLESAGGEATMSGRAHLAHFDFLIHAARARLASGPFWRSGAESRYTRGSDRIARCSRVRI